MNLHSKIPNIEQHHRGGRRIRNLRRMERRPSREQLGFLLLSPRRVQLVFRVRFGFRWGFSLTFCSLGKASCEVHEILCIGLARPSVSTVCNKTIWASQPRMVAAKRTMKNSTAQSQQPPSLPNTKQCTKNTLHHRDTTLNPERSSFRGIRHRSSQ